MQRSKRFMVLALAAVAFHSTACSLTIEQILAMQEGSTFELSVLDLPATVLPVEGGTVMNIDIFISIFDLILGDFEGDITTGDLLFTAPPFNFLGIPAFNTGEICVVLDEVDPGGGTFEANLYSGSATFDVQLNTVILIGNPVLAALLPGGGFAFPFDLQSTVPLSLGDMLGLLTGSGDLQISQTLDQSTDFELDPDGPGGNPPTVLPAHIGGTLTLASADAFPTSPLLEDCIEFLAE
jgi:hypothetical protein